MQFSADSRRTAIWRVGLVLSSIGLALAGAAVPAHAQSRNAAASGGAPAATSSASRAPIAVTLKVPLILPGIGIDLTAGFNRHLDVRLGYSDLPYTYRKSGTLSQSNGGFGYSGRSEDRAWDLLLDYRPFGNAFRLTGGVYGPSVGLKVTGVPTEVGTFTINGDAYTVSDVGNLHGRAGWYSIAPYVGLGRDGFNQASTRHPFYFSFDVGVVLARAKGALNYTCTAGASICGPLASDISAQQSKLNATIGSISVLPLLQIGVGYRF